MRRTRILLRFAGALGVLGLLAGCGLFDEESPETSEGPSGNQSEEAALATDLLPTSDGLPDGFDEADVPAGYGSALQQGVPDCVDAEILARFDVESEGATIRSFTNGAGDTVAVSMWVFPDVETASDLMSEVSGVPALVTTCFTAILESGREAFGLSPDLVITPTFEADTGLGDESATLSAPPPAPGEEPTVKWAFIQVENAIAGVLTVARSDEFDAGAAEQLVVEQMQATLE